MAHNDSSKTKIIILGARPLMWGAMVLDHSSGFTNVVSRAHFGVDRSRG